ncbi:hypothetical protein [Paracoccus sp. DMF]|uniref:hypothetical protein n=1 Tax=Paracoccus sp. DMF TaxID=400837 RepID=UPI0021E50A77|nr:hypothetical protein [Paracoccus sp. DMF]MCV2446609.1 hypothetical protein [Paracoccus sp. DMF]
MNSRAAKPGPAGLRFLRMSRMGAQLLTVAVLAFVASTMAYALMPGRPAAGPPSEAPGVDLAWLFLRPRDPGMLALLATVWAALGYHLLRLWLEIRRIARAGWPPAQSAGPPVPEDLLRQHDRDMSLLEHLPLILALLVGAVWPWLLAQTPVMAFLLSAVTLAGALAAALRGIRQGAVVKRSSTLGFIAGWALLVCLTVFAGLLEQRLGVPQKLAVGLAMLIGAVAAVSVQLRMPRRTGFSVALIWGLIGIAASTVSTDATIATATVVAIAIIAVALVRATT